MRKKWLHFMSFLFLTLSFFLWSNACSTRKKEETSTIKDDGVQQTPAVQKPDTPYTPPVTKYGARPVVKYGVPPAYDTLKKPIDN